MMSAGISLRGLGAVAVVEIDVRGDGCMDEHIVEELASAVETVAAEPALRLMNEAVSGQRRIEDRP